MHRTFLAAVQFDVATRGLLADELARVRATGAGADTVRAAAAELNAARKRAVKGAKAAAAGGATADELVLNFRLELDELAACWAKDVCAPPPPSTPQKDA